MFEIYLRDKENCPGYNLRALFKIPIDKNVISVVPILFLDWLEQVWIISWMIDNCDINRTHTDGK